MGLRVHRNLMVTPRSIKAGKPSKNRFVARALTSSPNRISELRALGITPLVGNLDCIQSLRRLARIATHVIHLVPPANSKNDAQDARTRALVQALRMHTGPKPVLIYVSTTAVYGDAQGAKIDETAPLRATTLRGLRRIDAEKNVRSYGRATGARSTVLRVPGIYAPNRAGGTPRTRLLKKLPVLAREDDIYTSHIHADDLARAICVSLWRSAPQRIYNISDDSELMFGDYFDLAADLYQLPRPARVSRAQAQGLLSASQLSFMQDSRRLSNRRLKHELGVKLRFPTVAKGLKPL